MQYVFKLSGESPSIAIAELRALFEIFNLSFKILKTENNLAYIRISATQDLVTKLCERSAFIKSAYISGQKFWEVPKGRFLEREPQQKPAFHPTTLKPKLARALVNLSRIKEGEVLLDPFCGAGSVLVEGAILGAKVIGVDFDSEMIARAKKNLNYYKKLYKNKKFELKVADATKLEKVFKLNSISAIATDLPYGRSSRSSTRDLYALYETFFASAYNVLKPKPSEARLGPAKRDVSLGNRKCLVAMYPHYINAKKQINKKQWTLVAEGELYVHGSLIRKLLVLRKI